MDVITRKGGLLYPMLVIAAIAVIVFSVTGIATMMGWLPSALSGRNVAPGFEPSAPRGDAAELRPAPGAPLASQTPQPAPPASAACPGCGVVESIRSVETQDQTSWLGAAGGAVVGGLLGNEIGRGGGRTAATVVGAGAGAYTGNEIEKHLKKSVRYRVRVRMDDGSYRTLHQAAQPGYAVGQKVRVTEMGVVPLEERRTSIAGK
jgi:outer membrane lipoprotein SlyB